MAVSDARQIEAARGGDQRVYLHGVSWDDYETLLSIRGESSGVRITFLRGEVELMSPSIDHEGYKTCVARLLEVFAMVMGLDLNGFGSWTIKSQPDERGAEPDECYILGRQTKSRPDIAIEVIWTHGGIDKLEVYRGLGVPEVWNWKDGRIAVHRLEGGSYVERDRSAVLPDLDLERLASFVDPGDQTRAARRYWEWLEANRR